MRILKYLIAIIMTVSIALSIWYHLPIEHNQKYVATTFEGDQTTTIELKVKKYRKFFRPTIIEGELIHNDKVFNSYSSTIGNSWFEKLGMKLDGQVNPTIFTYANPNFNLLEWESWTLTILSSDTLQALELRHRLEGKSAESYTYYAPATNAQEAQQILKQLINFTNE